MEPQPHFVVCHCKACSSNIEFDASRAGETVPCPHCGQETSLSLSSTDLIQLSLRNRPQQPPTKPRFVTCRCQHCDGNIEFDANGLRPGEARTADCPHCKMETLLFVHVQSSNSGIKKEPVNPRLGSVLKAGRTIGGIEAFVTGNFERFVFALVRFFAVFWAVVILLGFLTCTINYISTFFPSKDNPDQPQSLLGQASQSPALENLGIYLGGLFVLFCALTMISFALLLLAIERNTRKKKPSLPESVNSG